MSLLFLKRVLANPRQVGYIVPSSPFLTSMTAGRMDFSRPRVIVELGPGEGCHTRKIARRMTDGCRMVLFELDGDFVRHLENQFRDDPRVTVLHEDAARLPARLLELGHARCDYIVSGLPFFVMDPALRQPLLDGIAAAMDPETRFITYQVSLGIFERSEHFALAGRAYCPLNVPPINVFEFRRA
jgi:phospholipid N-methyltransferase